MAKFDVFPQKAGGCYVLDCQADLLGALNTRLVVPLLRIEDAPTPAARLNPILDIEGERLVMVTQFAAAMPMRELGEPVCSLLAQQDAINTALDMLIVGF